MREVCAITMNKRTRAVQIRLLLEKKSPRIFSVAKGKTLREALLENEATPYRGNSKQLNCKGFGICGTCKVEIKEEGQFWTRRSCQIQCFEDIEVRLQ